MAISDTTLNEFTINYLSQTEFNNLTTKNANELYLTPDDSITSITAGSGLSGGGASGVITLNHSNSVSEKTTQGLYPITFDAQGHITGAGSAATIPTITLNGTSTTSPSFYAPTSAGTSGYYLKSNGTGAPTWQQFPTIPTDTNTWRKVQLNGVDKLGTGISTNPLNLKAGTNISITESSGTFTFDSTDQYTGTVTSVATSSPITGGTITSSGTIGHATSGVTAGTYNNVTVNTYGHVTAGSNTSYLTSHQTIKQDGVTGATGNHFGTSSTAATTAAKTVSITAGTPTLEAGLRVIVKFTNANTANSPTLNVNSLGAKNIFHNGAQITSGSNKALLAGTVEFVYDGTQWQLVGNYVDTNTTYTWSSLSGKPTATGSSTTGISIAAHSSTSIYGVKSTTTTASKASGGNGSASSWTFGSATVGDGTLKGTVDSTDTTMLIISANTTTVQQKTGGSNGTAPTWSFTDVTVPIRNDSTTAVVTSTGHTITDPGHTHTIS